VSWDRVFERNPTDPFDTSIAGAPHRLRHSVATKLRVSYGIEATQTVLGHADPKVTLTYAERDYALAARIMREVG
jgi:site-specific recombinase XerC